MRFRVPIKWSPVEILWIFVLNVYPEDNEKILSNVWNRNEMVSGKKKCQKFCMHKLFRDQPRSQIALFSIVQVCWTFELKNFYLANGTATGHTNGGGGEIKIAISARNRFQAWDIKKRGWKKTFNSLSTKSGWRYKIFFIIIISFTLIQCNYYYCIIKSMNIIVSHSIIINK